MVNVRRVNLGLQDYQSINDAMRRRVIELKSGETAELWIVEHPAVFTQGQAGKSEHILAPGNIPIIKSDRGGQVTYHGPGQVVIYTLIPLKIFGLNVRDLVQILEKSVITLLASFNIPATDRTGAPGVYVNGQKIASIGLRIRQGMSYHGVALNVDMDLEPFSRIHPCGFDGLEVAQISNYVNCEIKSVRIQLCELLEANLRWSALQMKT